jgi:glucose-6-phosphate isomerase
MKYSIHNIDLYKNNLDLAGYVTFLKERVGRDDFDHGEDSLNVPFDTSIFSDIKHFVEDTRSDKLKYVFVIGIGGSNLGPRALYNALKIPGGTQAVWIDTVDEANLDNVFEIIKGTSDKEEIAVVISSKSGKTTETLVNAGNILNFFEEKYKDIYDRVAVVTDKDSSLDVWADEHRVERFHIPTVVGGRFSVFTAVGMLPLLLLGHDVTEIVRGAQEAVENFSEEAFAVESARAIFVSHKDGKNILDTFLFKPELEDYGKWYRQLIAESLGKERDIENKTVYAGITPTVSIGSTDLHSVGQLYIGGPRDKVSMFVSSRENDLMKISKHSISRDVSFVHGKKVGSINKAILDGVIEVYGKNNFPFIHIEFEENKMRELGYIMQSLMIQTMVLGFLMNINAFNQPNVESYKTVTRDILKRP